MISLLAWGELALRALYEAGLTVLLVGAIVVPLMVGLEWLRAAGALARLSRPLERPTRWLGLSPEAAFPLLAGLVFGLAYGGGLLVDSWREGRLRRQDVFLLTVFLCVCHAVIEDTLLFVPLGVNPTFLLLPRVGLGVALTLLARWILARRDRRRGLEGEGVPHVHRAPAGR